MVWRPASPSTLTAQSSGVAVEDKCLEVYQDLKLKKKYKYIIYKLAADSSSIVIEKAAETGDYDGFIAALPKDDCRYAIYDFDYEKPGEGQRSKICFYAWCVVCIILDVWAVGGKCVGVRFCVAQHCRSALPSRPHFYDLFH
jgi:hypothetical protein